jgi:hypothetical protein
MSMMVTNQKLNGRRKRERTRQCSTSLFLGIAGKQETPGLVVRLTPRVRGVQGVLQTKGAYSRAFYPGCITHCLRRSRRHQSTHLSHTKGRMRLHVAD